MNPLSQVGRLWLFLQLGFKQAAELDRNPKATPTLKHQVKQAYNGYWNAARLLVMHPEKALLHKEYTDDLEDFAAMLYEWNDIFCKSESPEELLTIVKKSLMKNEN